jgi:hypothetical protein
VVAVERVAAAAAEQEKVGRRTPQSGYYSYRINKAVPHR